MRESTKGCTHENVEIMFDTHPDGTEQFTLGCADCTLDLLDRPFGITPNDAKGLVIQAADLAVKQNDIASLHVLERTLTLYRNAQTQQEKPMYWKTQATALETDRAQALAKAKRLEADLEEATAQMAKMQRELTDARKLIELKTHDTHSSIKERDGLREQLAGYEDRFARVTKALQEKVAQLEEQKATLQNMVEGLKASAKQAADERDKARAELRTALDDRKELPEWMGEYSEEALAFIRKLDGLVQEGILEPHEARTKYTAKYGHAS